MTYNPNTIPWLRSLASKGGKGGVTNVDARSLGRVADEMERLLADAARHKHAVDCVLLACDMLPQLDSQRTKAMIAEALAETGNTVEHLPGCPHAQNMARPRSQQLIGPKCECRAERRRSEEFREWLDSDEGKATIEAAAQRLSEKGNG